MTVIVRQLHQQAYEPIWEAMHQFTDARDADTTDEIWLVEHFPVYTQGQAEFSPEYISPIIASSTSFGLPINFDGDNVLLSDEDVISNKLSSS